MDKALLDDARHDGHMPRQVSPIGRARVKPVGLGVKRAPGKKLAKNET